MLDLINFLFLFSLTFIILILNNIPKEYAVYLFIHYILVFFLNGVLFDISYFPDQNRYLMVSELIRENLAFFNYWEYDRNGFGVVTNASLLFSIFPILFIDSVYSISLINTTIYSFVFIFLYKKGILRGKTTVFYLLFPSLALYSGMGLRDTWIFFFMLISIYFFIKERFLLSFLFSLVLLLIKVQNFGVFIISIVAYKILVFGRQNFLYIFIKIIVMIAFVQLLINIIGIEFLDFYRLAFFAENGGKIDDYQPLTGSFDVLIKSTLGAFTFMLRPFPWESNGMFQLVQSLENIIVFSIVVKLVQKQFKVNNKKVWFLIVFLFVGMSINGLIIFNFGTAIRYRYTFVVIFIIFSYYLLYIKKDEKK